MAEQTLTVVKSEPLPAAPEAPSWLGDAGQWAKDLGIGVMKGGGQTFVNLGHLIDRFPGVKGAIDRAYGVPGLSDQAFGQADKAVTPTNTAQSLGAAGEHIAEAIVPGRTITAAAANLSGRVAPTLAPYVGQTAARLLPYATAEAAGGAGMAAAQGSSPLAGAAGGGALAAAPTVAAAAGQRLMQSAVKPTQALLSEYRTTAPKLVQTLLDEGVNVTQGGVDKLQKLLHATNQEIRDAVANSTGTIDKRAVASYTPAVAAKFVNQVNPTADLDAVKNTVSEFMNHPVYTGQKLSVPEAQALKVGTYQQIGKKYGEVSSAGIETQKALARGLKEQIAAEVPGIAGLNAKDSDLMAALDAVGRRVALAGNRDPVGFAWVAQHPTTFLAALMDRSPVVKSMLARGLYQTAGRAAKIDPQLIRTAVTSLAESAEPAEAAQAVR